MNVREMRAAMNAAMAMTPAEQARVTRLRAERRALLRTIRRHVWRRHPLAYQLQDEAARLKALDDAIAGIRMGAAARGMGQ